MVARRMVHAALGSCSSLYRLCSGLQLVAQFSQRLVKESIGVSFLLDSNPRHVSVEGEKSS